MRRVLIIILSVALVALTADTIRLKMQNSPKGNSPEGPGFWSKLIEEGQARKAWERKEEQMATVSLIVALLAVTAAGGALYGLRRTRRRLSRFEEVLLSSEQKQELFEAVAEIRSLRSHAEQLRCSVNEELERFKHAAGELDDHVTRIEQRVAELQLSGTQLDDRISKIEKAFSNLGAMSEELEELQGFKHNVEQLHNRLRQALNANATGTKVTPIAPRFGQQRKG
jgi:methyl-accepting chemotaxis protein